MHCLYVLMNCTPRDISKDDIKKEMLKIRGVKSVIDLRVWSLSDGKNVLTMHLGCSYIDGTQLEGADKILREKFQINHFCI